MLAGVSKLCVWVPEVGHHGGVALRAGVSMAGSQKKLFLQGDGGRSRASSVS